MKHGIWKNKQMTKRLLSLTLACVMTLGLLPGMTTPVSADETADDSPFCSPDPNEHDAALNVLTAYRWKRVHKQSDLPQTKDKKVHVLILGYQDGKTGADDPVYYLMGDNNTSGREHQANAVEFPKSAYLPNPMSSDASNDIFYTTELISDTEIAYTGDKDSKNENAMTYRMYSRNGNLIELYDDLEWKGYNTTHKNDHCAIYTHDLSTGDYGKNLPDYMVRIYHERSHSNDCGLDIKTIDGKPYYNGWHDGTYEYDKFVLYVAEEITITAITADYTIRDDMVMNVKNGVLLVDGVTLTVQPGGVLSIEGQFYNNGVINNYGTVIVQENSCITSFLPKSTNTTAGKILNSGKKVEYYKDVESVLQRLTDLWEAELENIADQQAIIAEETEAITTLQSALKVKLAQKTASGTTVEKEMENLEANIEGLEEQQEKIQQKKAVYSTANGYKEDANAAKSLSDEEVTAMSALFDTEVITPVRDQLEEVAGDVKDLQGELTAAQAAKMEAEQSAAASEKKVERCARQIKENETMLKSLSKTATKQGEGNLIVMNNARVVFNEATDSRLVIEEGGSCVCNGYIVHPNTILLSDSKFHIRKEGAVMAQYAIKKNVLNARGATVSNAKTKNVSLTGMEECVKTTDSMLVSGDYVFKVDGVYRYAENPIRNATTGEIQAIKAGDGKWETKNGPEEYVDDEGSRVSVATNGDKTTVKKDGTVITYTKSTDTTVTMIPGGTVITVDSTGRSREVRPNGDFIYLFADKSIEKMLVHLPVNEGGGVQEYDSTLQAIVTTYTNSRKDNDISKEIDYQAGALKGYRDVYHFGKEDWERLNVLGEELFHYVATEKTYYYKDYHDVVDTNGDIIKREYTSGALEGAKVERFQTHDVDEILGSELLWKVTTPFGKETTCRLWHVVDGVCRGTSKAYVWRFADGSTCTVTNETYGSFDFALCFAVRSDLKMAPKTYNLTLDETAVNLPMMETASTPEWYSMAVDQRPATITMDFEGGGTATYTKSLAGDNFTGKDTYLLTEISGIEKTTGTRARGGSFGIWKSVRINPAYYAANWSEASVKKMPGAGTWSANMNLWKVSLDYTLYMEPFETYDHADRSGDSAADINVGDTKTAMSVTSSDTSAASLRKACPLFHIPPKSE